MHDAAPRCGPAASAGRSGRSTCRRRSGSVTPAVTSPSPRSSRGCVPSRDRLARPTPRHDGARGGGRARSTRPAGGSPTSRRTSPRSPASTTCTASRRCAAWTRSSSPTSWCSRRSSRKGSTTSSIGDEAWDVDHFWHENPELKRGQHVWLTDFVGFLPMPDGGEHEAFLTTDYNAEMIEHIARYPWIRDRAIFVGNPDDIVARPFGAGLPAIRDWTEEHFAFSGYITGFTPPPPDEVPGLARRARLPTTTSWCASSPSAAAASGGRSSTRSSPPTRSAKRQLPALRMVAVAGPRIDPAAFPSHPGLEVHGYVDRLYRHLSRLRPRRRPGWAHDDDGAGRRQAAVPLLPAAPPLRAELPRAPPPRSVRRRPLHGLRHDRSRLPRRGHRRRASAGRSTYRDVETDGAARAAQLIAELV